jgi:hypothetical protein
MRTLQQRNKSYPVRGLLSSEENGFCISGNEVYPPTLMTDCG